jgi:hypothetical protein
MMHLQQVEGFGIDPGGVHKPSEKYPRSSALARLLVVFPSPVCLRFFGSAFL